MVKRLKIISCLILFLFGIYTIKAQEVPFPGNEKIVFKNIEEQLEIFENKQGQLQAKSKVIEDIQLLNNDGLYQLTNQDVQHGYFSELKDINAYTVLPDKKGTKVPMLSRKTRKDKSGYVFYEDSKETTVTFSSLETNCRTHLEYDLFHRDVHLIPTVFITRYAPVEKFTYKVIVPKGFELKFVQKNIGDIPLKYTVEEKRNEIVHTFYAEKLPKYKIPVNAPNVRYYLPHIIPVPESMADKKGNEEILLKDVQGLYQYYVNQLKNVRTEPDESLISLSDKIVGSATTFEEKVSGIYKWVQSNVKYIAFEDGYEGFIPRPPVQVCNKKYGDCKDMATLLVSLLRAQKLYAYQVWVGTRDIPYSYREVPTPVVDNHMICAVENEGKWYFLDATNPILPLGVTPSGLQGKEALVGISPGKYEIVKLDVSSWQDNYVYDTCWIEIEGSAVFGKNKVVIGGYRAYDILTELLYVEKKDQEDHLKKYLSKGNNKFHAENIQWYSPDDKTIVIEGDIRIDNYVQRVKNNVYVQPVLTQIYSNYDIETKDRNVKMDNQWANHVRYTSFLQLPDGVDIVYRPVDKAGTKKGQYEYNVRYVANPKNEIMSDLYIRYDLLDINKEDFEDHNRFIKELKETYNDLIHIKE